MTQQPVNGEIYVRTFFFVYYEAQTLTSSRQSKRVLQGLIVHFQAYRPTHKCFGVKYYAMQSLHWKKKKIIVRHGCITWTLLCIARLSIFFSPVNPPIPWRQRERKKGTIPAKARYGSPKSISSGVAVLLTFTRQSGYSSIVSFYA